MDDVAGLSATPGTPLLYVEVEPGKILFVTQIFLCAKTSETTFIIAESDKPDLTGTLTPLLAINVEQRDPIKLTGGGGAPLCVIDNSTNPDPKYLMIYVPHISEGSVVNDNTTDYFSASVGGFIE